MAEDFAKLTVADLKERLTAAKVEFPAEAKKAELVALAQEKITEAGGTVGGSEAGASAGEETPKAPEASKDFDPESVTEIKQLGFSPTGRFEVACLNPDAAPDARFFRVFGPLGNPCSPVFAADKADEAYKIQGGQNVHVQRANGNVAYNAIVEKAKKQGFSR